MESYNRNLGQGTESKDKAASSENWGKGRVWAGLIVIAVGSIWIAREAGVPIPYWLTRGPIWLVAIGLFIGARSSFRNWFWLIPFGVGVALIVNHELDWRYDFREYIWPVVIIAIGLFMIFKPKRKNEDGWIDWRKMNADAGNSSNTGATGEQDTIETVSIFGSTKKNILSKDFRGGEVVNFFGGTELNLMQADITKPIVLEMVQVFGGAKLIVPSNWTIHTSELVSVFGGVDDKRMIQATLDPTKILILRGTNVFGGMEIKSY